jgi:hypothetical protein
MQHKEIVHRTYISCIYSSGTRVCAFIRDLELLLFMSETISARSAVFQTACRVAVLADDSVSNRGLIHSADKSAQG